MPHKDHLNIIKDKVKMCLSEHLDIKSHIKTSIKRKVENGLTDVIKFSIHLDNKTDANDLLVYVNRQDNSHLRFSTNMGKEFLTELTNKLLPSEFLNQFEQAKKSLAVLVDKYLLVEEFEIDEYQLFTLSVASSKAYSGQYIYHKERLLGQNKMNKNIYKTRNDYFIMKSTISFKYDGNKIFAFPSLIVALGSERFIIDFNTTSHFSKKLKAFHHSILSLVDIHFYETLKKLFDIEEENARLMTDEELNHYIDVLKMSKI